MKVCFPVKDNKGLDSPVFGHFGSAPIFLVVDSDTEEVVEVVNRDLQHAHGRCKPLLAMGGNGVDSVVVGGIGGGALRGLTQAGISVFKADGGSVSDNLKRFRTEDLTPCLPHQVCGGHGHGHGAGGGCGHR